MILRFDNGLTFAQFDLFYFDRFDICLDFGNRFFSGLLPFFERALALLEIRLPRLKSVLLRL